MCARIDPFTGAYLPPSSPATRTSSCAACAACCEVSSARRFRAEPHVAGTSYMLPSIPGPLPLSPYVIWGSNGAPVGPRLTPRSSPGTGAMACAYGAIASVFNSLRCDSKMNRRCTCTISRLGIGLPQTQFAPASIYRNTSCASVYPLHVINTVPFVPSRSIDAIVSEPRKRLAKPSTEPPGTVDVGTAMS